MAELRCCPIVQAWGGCGGAEPALGPMLLPGGPGSQRAKVGETLWGLGDLMGGKKGKVGRL